MKAKFSRSEEMIKGLLSKDKTALEVLYERYGDEVYGVISCAIANQDSRVRVLHNVIMSIWDTIDQFNPENERFFTWLMKVVRHNIASEFRNPALVTTEKVLEAEQNDLLDIIDPRDYPIYYKVFFFGASVEEVGKEYSMQPVDVRKSLHNAIGNLRRHFSQPFDL